jgi:hypothetical protein
MALKHSLGLRNFSMANGMATAFDTNGRLAIYTGSPPTDADSNATGTKLGTLTLPADAFDLVSGGMSVNLATGDSSADATGTAGWFRFYINGEDPDTVTAATGTATTQRRLDGTVGTSGTDMLINNASVVAGGTIDLADGAWQYNHAP